jgi:TM2 domain-containing membrane protein YozV
MSSPLEELSLGDVPPAPSKHFSDIETWKNPDRSYYLFVTLSVLFGFFGLDHFYLRSFGTGGQKFLVNLFTFGMWYVWDLTQIFFDNEKVRVMGLDSPLEWVRGIGRGVFLDPADNAILKNENKVIRSKKDLVVYAIFTIFFGLIGLEKFYMGQPWQGLTKALTVFNFLFFLFGIFWVIWDIVNVVCYTDNIFEGGITPPIPFNFIFGTKDTKGLFIPELISKDQLHLEHEIFKKAWSFEGFVNSHFWAWNWDIWFWNWNAFRRSFGMRDVQPKRSAFDMSVPGVFTMFNISDMTKPPVMPLPAGSPQPPPPELTVPQVVRLPGQSGGSLGSTDSVNGPIIAGTLSAIVLAGFGKTIMDILAKKAKE